MLNPNFIYLGVLFQAIGGLKYLLDTIKGKIQPNKVSWLLWALAPLVAFFAEIKQGVGIQSLATFIVGFVPLVIFLASFLNKKSKWELGRIDFFCGMLSVSGLLLWFVTKVGNVAIFFSIISDGLAAVPTMIKSYHHPESENNIVYLFGIINALVALLVINNWNFQHYGFPAYLLFVNFILVILIRFKFGKHLKKFQ